MLGAQGWDLSQRAPLSIYSQGAGEGSQHAKPRLCLPELISKLSPGQKSLRSTWKVPEQVMSQSRGKKHARVYTKMFYWLLIFSFSYRSHDLEPSQLPRHPAAWLLNVGRYAND